MDADIVQDDDVVADSEEDELSIPAGSVSVLKSPLKDIVNSGQTQLDALLQFTLILS